MIKKIKAIYNFLIYGDIYGVSPTYVAHCAGDCPKACRDSIGFWQRKYLDVVSPGWDKKEKL